MAIEKKVKLQKQKAYEYEGHPIFKYRLNIPSEIIRELGWDTGDDDKKGMAKKNYSIALLIKVRDKKLEISRTLSA